MAQFDPPDSHWAADFDQRLQGTFHYLKDRIDGLDSSVADSVKALSALVAEAQQYVLDARYWADRAKDGK